MGTVCVCLGLPHIGSVNCGYTVVYGEKILHQKEGGNGFMQETSHLSRETKINIMLWCFRIRQKG